ncbi:MAG: hypothetical protein LKE77_08235 [Companilactobacillus sp.]|jgi:hypothetical protein|uniref:hypothetical protein n=1 Tax=Companilactobacillus sp. TaxID=2767905 RepID=UPI0025BB7BFF|nr:hypothetical protein [Companilactobacillus sp.]MCH4010379.1 hypothetical protein [Companilactobacillus sp.]MCH4051945.1 hypothetical protein [Companilactobacillus sp.]MCH4075819.1 hypothetical protein [Companilactobacillus sp.]MCH4126897.1 hypothetical protein [Companilactobacillus sp.]
MIKITEDTSYINFLNDNDENFTEISNNISSVYKLLQSLYMTDRSYTPSFKKLVNSFDDVKLYNNLYDDYHLLNELLNNTVDMLNKAGVANLVTHDEFKHIYLEIPKQLELNETYIEIFNKDWQAVDDFINELDTSLFIYKEEK